MPTFSEMEITFTTDFIAVDTLKITTDNFGDEWTWVTSRGAAYEVSSALLGGITGTSTATQFETAFDLDKATGYITTRVDNVLTIQSETDGEDFLGIKGGDSNFGAFTVTFTNVVTPPTPATVDYALMRSPYYVNIPFNFTTTTSTTLTLFVWDGDLTVVPGTASRTLTKIRPTVDYAEFNIDLSKLIREFLNPVPKVVLTLSSQIVDVLDDGLKWAKYTASYTDPSEIIPDIEGTLAAIDGYGYMQEGVNPDVPTSKVLTNCANRKVSRDGFILFPYLNEGTITSIEVDSETGEINDTLTMTTSNESTDALQYISIDVSTVTTDEYITVTTKPNDDAFVYEVIDECKFSPISVVFLNKYGAYDTITMFKKRTDELSVTSEDFKNNYISGGTYDIAKHQIQKLNVIGNDTVSVNSGYISEAENTLYKELVLSEKVFFYENSTFVPVNVDTKTFKPLTRTNDRLIKYNIYFSYAYNTINNI